MRFTLSLPEGVVQRIAHSAFERGVCAVKIGQGLQPLVAMNADG